MKTTTTDPAANDAKTRGFGWRPELPDVRDKRFSVLRASLKAALPQHVDLRDKMPPVVDQGQTNSCVGNAIAALVDFLHVDPVYASGAFMPSSRRFIYWQARAREGWEDTDDGAYIRDGMKSLTAEGAPHELACRFDAAKINTKPQKVAFTQATNRRKIGSYHALETLDEMKACLAEGFPFVVGITVYTKFLSDDTAQAGEVNMPDPNNERAEGGHAILVVGYDESAQRFIWRNSWGDGWGALGYGTIPYAYLNNRDLADDLWTARL